MWTGLHLFRMGSIREFLWMQFWILWLREIRGFVCKLRNYEFKIASSSVTD